MNLPFFPTFFRKMDIFQQLLEYESQKGEKHLWEGEKALLMWAGSEHHQHLGSLIDIHHVEDALDYCVGLDLITEFEKNRMKGSIPHILESLPVHEFGELGNASEPKNPRVKINRNGILAGQILIETNNLKDQKKYQIWIYIWWGILGGAALILIDQSLTALLNILKSFKILSQ